MGEFRRLYSSHAKIVGEPVYLAEGIYIQTVSLDGSNCMGLTRKKYEVGITVSMESFHVLGQIIYIITG